MHSWLWKKMDGWTKTQKLHCYLVTFFFLLLLNIDWLYLEGIRYQRIPVWSHFDEIYTRSHESKVCNRHDHKMYIMDRRAHFHFKHWLSKSCYVGLSWVFEIRCDEIWLRKWWDTITHAFIKGDLLITSYAILYVFDANGTKLLLRNGHYFLKIGHDTGDFKTKT